MKKKQYFVSCIKFRAWKPFSCIKYESMVWAKRRILNDLNRTFSDSTTDHIEEDLEGDEIKESNNPLYSSR